MSDDCRKYRNLMLEAALAGTAATVLDEHVRQCSDCAGELEALRARRERLDALLPLVAGQEGPSAGFHNRVLAAAKDASQRKHTSSGGFWLLAGATAVMVVALAIGSLWQRRTPRPGLDGELVAAEKLAEWRAPSDVLLETPGQEILRTTPKLGESYLKPAANRNEEK
jgi:anti-sigma factor RsiW